MLSYVTEFFNQLYKSTLKYLAPLFSTFIKPSFYNDRNSETFLKKPGTRFLSSPDFFSIFVLWIDYLRAQKKLAKSNTYNLFKFRVKAACIPITCQAAVKLGLQFSQNCSNPVDGEV